MSTLQNFFDQPGDNLELQQDPFTQQQQHFTFPLQSSILPPTSTAHTTSPSRTQPTHQTALQPTEYEPCFTHVDRLANYYRAYILQPSTALDNQSNRLERLSDQLRRQNDSQSREIAALKNIISKHAETEKARIESLKSEMASLQASIESQLESHKRDIQKIENALTRLNDGLTAFSNFAQERWG